jgi:hypothetical protein
MRLQMIAACSRLYVQPQRTPSSILTFVLPELMHFLFFDRRLRPAFGVQPQTTTTYLVVSTRNRESPRMLSFLIMSCEFGLPFCAFSSPSFRVYRITNGGTERRNDRRMKSGLATALRWRGSIRIHRYVAFFSFIGILTLLCATSSPGLVVMDIGLDGMQQFCRVPQYRADRQYSCTQG